MHICAAAMVAFCSSLANAQVEQTQTGSAIDANYLVGSGGYNTPRTQGQIGSQLYIYGQVTGLGGFQGHVPYPGANRLNVALPSENLGRFTGQSVGLADVLGGPTYAVNPFFDRSATVVGLHGIASGLALPGSNVPISAAIGSTAAAKLYEDALSPYAPVYGRVMDLGSAAAVRATVPVGTGAIGMVAPPSVGAEGSSEAMPLSTAAPDSLGLSRARDRAKLARELYELAHRDDSVDRRVSAEVDASVRQPAQGGQGASKPEDLPGTGREETTPVKGAGEPGRPDASLPAPNQDVFLDVLVQLRRGATGRPGQAEPAAEELKTRRPTVEAAPDLEGPVQLVSKPPSPTITPAEPAPTESSRTQEESPGAVVAAAPKDLVEAGTSEGIVIHGLAGKHADMFNQFMAKAEKQLKDGDFYAAVDDYELAATLNSANPLARLGMAAALFGAGEPLTAAVHLRRALELFPPIMETRLDAPSLIGRTTFNRRIANLDSRLNEQASPDPLLALLATYMHAAAGEKVEAARCARKLSTAAGDDKLLNAYADFVLTGKRPGPLQGPHPTSTQPTQPATTPPP